MNTDSHSAKPPSPAYFWPYDFEELRRAVAALEGLNGEIGAVNPRPSGWRNCLIQFGKRVVARLLAWYTRPLRRYNSAVTRSLEELAGALDHASMNMAAVSYLVTNIDALQARLVQSEKRSAELAELVQHKLIWSDEPPLGKPVARGSLLHSGNGAGTERTAYVIGLFGTGRLYINELILQNIGERAKYFRDTIRLHPGPTPMIYSGHVTSKYVCWGQARPAVMKRIQEAVDAGYADTLFVYRHPFDSLLTNWVWWRTYIRDSKRVAGISEVYKTTDDLCSDLAQNFSDFEAFAQGNPCFFSSLPGERFLSFQEFVEETELHIRSSTLALRLENFMTDPAKEFLKIAHLLSEDPDARGFSVKRPKSRLHGYLGVRDQVPQFRQFIRSLDAETRSRIERIGYDVTA